jgi:carbon-monoxide dehydrogenase small subunit
MEKHHIRLTVNGAEKEVLVAANRTLTQLLRDDLGLTGTKHGCGVGDCGSCTVLLDGEPVNSCLVLAVQAAGREVVTVEGLSADVGLGPLQQAFVDLGAIQCGFCTPGMLLSAQALLARKRRPSRREIREALAGNLCRCTGYQKIVDAVAAAARRGGKG